MRKQIFISLVFTLLFFNGAFAQFTGSGTSSDPYLITSDQDLQNLISAVNDGNAFAGIYFMQTADINLDESQIFPEGFTPIGGFDGNPFSGTYDGGGYSIKKMTISGSGNLAMFSNLNAGTVKNLNLENLNFSAEGDAVVAGIAATAANSEISNITVSGYLSATNDMSTLTLSGIAGASTGTSISGCVSLLTIDISDVTAETSTIGGIAIGTESTVSNCLISSFISGEYTSYYPIIDNGTATNCIVAESNGTASEHTATYRNCYFDHQNTLIADFPVQHSNIDGLLAFPTSTLTSGEMMNDSENWTETEGLYPRPASVANTNAALLAASPMMLDNADNISSVSSDFTVSTLNGVQWSSESENVSISNGNVSLTHDEDDTETEIYAYRGNLMKTIQINIVNSALGSKNNPILISTADDLFELAYALADSNNELGSNTGFVVDGLSKSIGDFDPSDSGETYFRLDADITIPEDSVWIPIGSDSLPFRWYFDGGNHTVDFGVCSSSNKNYTGLFGIINAARIYDLTVNGSFTTTNISTFGGIAAYAKNSEIYNCKATGNAVLTYQSGSLYETSETGTTYAGGIVAIDTASYIYNCSNEMNFTSGAQKSSYAGGIAASLANSTVEICTNTGNLYAMVMAGIVATDNNSTIRQCANYSTLSSVPFASYAEGTTIIDCANYGGKLMETASGATCTNIVHVLNDAYEVSSSSKIIDIIFSENSDTDDSDEAIFSNFYYDKQSTNAIGYCSSVNGLLTSELINASASDLDFEASKWTFINGRYPMPTGTDYTSERAILATTPFVLAANSTDSYETIGSVCSNFSINFDNNITWLRDTTYVLTETTVNIDSIRQDSSSFVATISSYITAGQDTMTRHITIPARLGSYDNPLLIESLSEFNEFSAAVSSTDALTSTYKGVGLDGYGTDVYFKLTTDIVAENNTTNIVNIVPVENFAGNLNCAGHTITISSSSDIPNGYLFGSISGAKIDSLNILIDSDLDMSSNDVKLLCNSAETSIISNCNVTVNGNFSINEGAMICGNLTNSQVLNCTVGGSGSLTASSNASGLIYESLTSEIKNCTNNLTIINSTNSNVTAGLILKGGELVIENCANNANISANDLCAGILAYADPNISSETTIITNSTNSGSITSSDYASGIVGYYSSSGEANLTVNKCMNSGSISGASVSGISSDSYGSTSNCANYGELTSTATAVGIALGENNYASQSVVAYPVSIEYSNYATQNVISENSDDDSFFDEQITEVKVDSLRLQFYQSGNARTTQGMIGDALADDLPGDWDFTDGLYPMPAGLSSEDPRNILARLPIILNAQGVGSGERITSVISNITLPQIDGLTWESSDPDIVAVASDGGEATVTNQEEEVTVTLTATYSGASRDFNITIHPITGTSADNPYTISTCTEFISMALNEQYPCGGYGLFFELANTIEISKDNIMIGNTVTGGSMDVNGYFYYGIETQNPYVLFPENYPFQGTLNGNGNKITWTNSEYEGDYYGLFKYTENAEISNLAFYYDETSSYNSSATLVGNAKATTISNCVVHSNLAATENVGGIVAEASDGTLINNCIFVGELSANNIGGIAAYAEDTRIANCISMLSSKGSSSDYPEVSSAILLSGENVEVDSCLVIGTNNDSIAYTICPDASAVTASECYYDSQMWILNGADNSITGKTTRELIGDSLFTSSSNWVHRENMYPVPAGTSGFSITRIVATPMLIGSSDADVLHVTDLEISAEPLEGEPGWEASSTAEANPVESDFTVNCVDVATDAEIMVYYDDTTATYSFTRPIVVTKGIINIVEENEQGGSTVCEGNEISFAVNADNATYQWTVTPEIEADALDNSSITLMVPENYLSENGTGEASLDLTITLDGCEKTAHYDFTVLPSASHIAISDTSICPGSDLTLNCTIDEGYEDYLADFEINWYDADDMSTVLNSGTSYYLPIVNESKNLKLVVNYTEGNCSDTLNVTISTIEVGEITLVSGEANQQICQGELIEPIVFSVANASYTVPEGIYAEYDSTENLLTLSGRPVAAGEQTYIISSCGSSFDGTIEHYAQGRIIDLSTNSLSQVIYLGDVVNIQIRGISVTDLRESLTWESSDGTETLSSYEMGANVMDLDHVAYLQINPEVAGEYIYSFTLPENGNCPAITVENFLGVYDTTSLVATAVDTTLCIGETATLATVERPGAYGGDYVWTLDTDTVGTGSQINVVPSLGTSTYEVMCGGKRTFGEIEVGDYISTENADSLVLYKNQEIISSKYDDGYIVLEIDEDSLLVMSLLKIETPWSEDTVDNTGISNYETVVEAMNDMNGVANTQAAVSDETSAAFLCSSDDPDMYLPSAGELGILMSHYDLFYMLLDNEYPVILSSTEKDAQTVYALNMNYGLMMEQPKTETATAMSFKKIAASDIVAMAGRTSNISRSGSVNIIVSGRQEMTISSEDLLCNIDTANVTIETEYPTVNWYCTSDPSQQVNVNDDIAIITEGQYIAVGTDEYGSCIDTVEVEIRNLAFEMPADTSACDSIALTIEKEDVVVMLDDEIVDSQTIVINETGTYTISISDPDNNDCAEERTVNITINNSYNGTINDTIYDGDAYVWNGDSIFTAGTYTFEGQTVNGCDSIVTLNLEVVSSNLTFVISGTITNVDASPMEDVSVTTSLGSVFSDSDGNYSIEVERSNPSVKYIKDGYNIVYIDATDSTTNINVVMEKPEIGFVTEDLELSTYPYVMNEIEIEITNNGDGPLTWSSIVVPDNINILPSKSTRGTRAMWDVVEAGFSTHSRAEQAVATDGFYIYTASWMRKGEFNRYTLDGYVETFNIQGVGAVRNLTYDGSRYFYATDNSNIIYKIDMGAHTVDSIVLDENMEVRYCAYVSENVFYVGNWNSLYMIVLGETITTIPMSSNLNNVYGIVYDKYNADGPCLWAFSQISQNSGPAALIQMLDSDGILTDVTHYVNDTVLGILASSNAGGICVSELLYDDKYVMLANIQNSTDNNKIAIYEIGKKDVWLSLDQKSGVIPAGESIVVRASELIQAEGSYSASIRFMPTVYNPEATEISFSTDVVAPQCSPVSNFVAVTDTFHVVNMTWDAADADEFDTVAYLIYDGSSTTPIDTTYDTSYTLRDPEIGTHCYSIRSYMTGITDCVSEASETSCIEIEALPCTAPLIFAVRPYSNNFNLSWNKVGGAEYYEIYRDEAMISTGITATSYIDTTVTPETEYCYKVIAYFQNDECDPIVSESICSTIITGICSEAPVLNAEATGNAARLKWNHIADAEFYSLYRDGQYITSTSDTIFVDFALEYETEYCYTVEIACEYGIYNLSETKCVTTGVAPVDPDGIEQITADDIDVYPNPASGLFYIAGAEIKSVTMANSMGQVVYSANDLNSDTVAINIEEMTSGVYALMIEVDGGEIIIKRIIVK